MVRPFIKPDPQIDFYAVFCTNIDDFLAGGPRDAWQDQRYYEPAPERFDRADQFGSSEIPSEGWDRRFGWDCEQFLLHRGTGTAWWLARSDIQEYLRRHSEGGPVDGLLEPVDPDDAEPLGSLTMADLQRDRSGGA